MYLPDQMNQKQSDTQKGNFYLNMSLQLVLLSQQHSKAQDTYMSSQGTNTLQHCRKALLGIQSYIISITARPTMFPWLRSWNALPASSKVYLLETAWPRLKIPVSANLTNLGRSCLALPPQEPITCICSNTVLICLDEKII